LGDESDVKIDMKKFEISKKKKKKKIKVAFQIFFATLL
jgi:hypothetical protein